MERTKIYNAKVNTPYKMINNDTILVENGKIAFVGSENIQTGDCCEINADGNYVSPEFIDIHLHGGGGHDFMDGSVKAFTEAAESHARHGTTSMVPTTHTGSNEVLKETLGSFKQAKRFEETKWEGEPAIRLCTDGYEALVLPGIGANLIELKETSLGLSLLRKPQNLATFKARPQVFGIPILFPPNRIENGTFKAAGKVYNFPINEPRNNHNHIHGFLCTHKFEVTAVEAGPKGSVRVELTVRSERNAEIYEYFPHEFEFKVLYKLSEKGLEQIITIKNDSTAPMPMGLGFHTAFNVPFHPGSKKENCSLRFSAGERWEVNEKMLPTGVLLPLSEQEEKFRFSGVTLAGCTLSGQYRVDPIVINDREFHGAIIEDKSNGLKLIYQTGKGYKHWVVWNDGGDKDFVCIEPQTWAVNAPNINLPDDVTGFRLLQPGETWTENCKICIEREQIS